ncbi:MAG: DUF302 domain-containing protein [Gemmatimonadota bacterium]
MSRVASKTPFMAKRWWIAACALVVGALTVSTSGLAAQQAPPPDFLITSRSSHGFNQTLATLRQAIEGENLMVVHEINPQQMLRMVGMRVDGIRQILFFHPRFMQRIIAANPNGGIEPPLKLVVMERPDGTVMVRYHDPVHQFAPYAGLEGVAEELAAIVDRVVGSVGG